MVSSFKLRHPSCFRYNYIICFYWKQVCAYSKCSSHALYSHAKIFLIHLKIHEVFYKVLTWALTTFIKSRSLKLKSRLYKERQFNLKDCSNLCIWHHWHWLKTSLHQDERAPLILMCQHVTLAKCTTSWTNSQWPYVCLLTVCLDSVIRLDIRPISKVYVITINKGGGQEEDKGGPTNQIKC